MEQISPTSDTPVEMQRRYKPTCACDKQRRTLGKGMGLLKAGSQLHVVRTTTGTSIVASSSTVVVACHSALGNVFFIRASVKTVVTLLVVVFDRVCIAREREMCRQRIARCPQSAEIGSMHSGCERRRRKELDMGWSSRISVQLRPWHLALAYQDSYGLCALQRKRGGAGLERWVPRVLPADRIRHQCSQ